VKRPGRVPYGLLWGGGLVFLLAAASLSAGPLTRALELDPMHGAAPKLLPPGSGGHPLGTDDLGRDILGRILEGGRRTLGVAIGAVGLALLGGIPIGALSGYSGRRLDNLLMRGMDIFFAFPSILLATAIVAFLGRGLDKVLLAVGLVAIPRFARQVRSGVLAERGKEYVQAARALGGSPLRILALQILPNCMGPVLVLASMTGATAILEVAGLGFIGLGVEPGTPEWGTDLNFYRKLLVRVPWTLLPPGCAIALAVLGFNLLGDGLNDYLRKRRS
jgi:peptide/nickel transport system permease protein